MVINKLFDVCQYPHATPKSLLRAYKLFVDNIKDKKLLRMGKVMFTNYKFDFED